MYLQAGKYVKDAWVDAAKIYQPIASDGDPLNAVLASHDSTTYDYYTNIHGPDPAPYSSTTAAQYHIYYYSIV